MLRKYLAEFQRLIRNHKYDVTDDGALLFPGANALIGGQFFHNVNGEDEIVDRNKVVNTGLNHLLSRLRPGSTAIEAWYISIYSADYTPTADLTAAQYPGTAVEIVSASEGYSEATRQPWTAGAPSGGVMDNLASRAALTIVTASSLVVRGAAVHQNNTKGDITGVLLAASKFANARTLYNGDVFNLGYRITITSP